MASAVLALLVGVLGWGCVTANREAEWVRLDVTDVVERAALANEPVFVTLALQQQNLERLEEQFWKVSDPTHADYQQYMTIEEIRALVSPTSAVQQRVVDWLVNGGVAHELIANRGDSLAVSMTVAIAEPLFGVRMSYWEHSESGQRVVRCSYNDALELPADVRAVVYMVEGLSALPVKHYSTKHGAWNTRVAGGVFDVVIPQSLFSMYNFPSPLPTTKLGNSQSVIEFEGESFSPAYLQAFGEKIGITIPPLSNSTIVGPNSPYNPGTEADLDIQFIAGIYNFSTNWFWLQKNPGWLYSFAAQFSGTSSVPLVASISYGLAEYDQCTVDSQECKSLGVTSHGYVVRVNTEFQKIGLRGVTLLAASGDSGANGRQDIQCKGKKLQPDYPAASPYLTAVGATMVESPQTSLPNPPALCSQGLYNCISGGDEVAVSYEQAQFTSGGGFSSVAAQPSYQAAAVAGYLKSNVTFPPASYFNKTGRAYPDVASFGKNCLIDTGVLNYVGGTSCSSPSFAAVVSLLNSVQFGLTGKPLGFINPLLYQMGAQCPHCFNDITVGDNICTEMGCLPGCKGFYCTKGWDPVTGFGSPNVQNMIAFIKAQMKNY